MQQHVNLEYLLAVYPWLMIDEEQDGVALSEQSFDRAHLSFEKTCLPVSIRSSSSQLFTQLHNFNTREDFEAGDRRALSLKHTSSNPSLLALHTQYVNEQMYDAERLVESSEKPF